MQVLIDIEWEDGKYYVQSVAEDKRLPQWPRLVIYLNHKFNKGNISLVYESCGLIEGKKYNLFRRLILPTCASAEDAELRGYIIADPDTKVWFRDLDGSMLEDDDILKLSVGNELRHAAHRLAYTKDLEGARDYLVGDTSLLKAGRANGTLLQRSGRGEGNGQGQSCINLLLTREAQRDRIHPARNIGRPKENELQEAELSPDVISDTVRGNIITFTHVRPNILSLISHANIFNFTECCCYWYR